MIMTKSYFRIGLLGLALTCTLGIGAKNNSLPGSGTDDEPYLIATYSDLKQIATDLTAIYSLTADIDATNSLNENSGAGWTPLGTSSTSSFSGKLHGHGHVISNLFINLPLADTGSNVGLFGYITAAAIDSVGVTNANITGNTNVGGLIGTSNGGTITNSFTTGSVTGTSFVGGLIGLTTASATSYSFSTAAVNVVSSGGGGLVGSNNYASTINYSYSTGKVTATGTSTSIVGGLVGFLGGTVSNSYSKSEIANGVAQVGGLVGTAFSNPMGAKSSIVNSYSIGKVNGTAATIGGLVGANPLTGTTVTNSYWNSETSGQTTSVLGTGRTAANLKLSSTFASWDFTNIWKIDTFNDGYPYLAWQKTTSTVTSVDNLSSVTPTVLILQKENGFVVKLANEKLLNSILHIYSAVGSEVYHQKITSELTDVNLPKGQYIGRVQKSTGESITFKTLVY